nr:S53 family peptidase [Kofleriaceae bacterium]
MIRVLRGGLTAVALLASSTALASPHRVKHACTHDKHCHALIRVNADGSRHDGRKRADALPEGLGAGDLQAAYGIDPTLKPAATVAVVDAFGYPTLEADLATYRATFGLPPCTIANGCLTILNQSGQTSPLPAEDTSDDGQGWQFESALDLDMASAACPNCKIIAVEATSDEDDGLDLCNDAAVTGGATVVSNSWGEPEGSIGADTDAHYHHAGVAVFASTGDDGNAGPGEGFPSTSLNVIAVGGTSLNPDVTAPSGFSESAWSDAGSVCSHSFSKPAWQIDTTCKNRVTGDVSAVADPETGVAVFAQGQWGVIGGTSASSPLVAAIFAATGHADATSEFIYENASSFTDVTTGNNGSCNSALCRAGSGWDGPTGIGSPQAPLLAGAKAPTFAMAPGAKAGVPPGFAVDVTCASNDSATVSEVDIGIDGQELASLTAPPFTKKMPATLAMGKHTIFARCKMSSLAVVGATADVDQVAPCSKDSDCTGSDELCFDGACIPGPAAAGGLGATCSGPGDCASADCGSDGRCVTACDATSACPTGFSCDTGSALCEATGGGGGGGCDTSGGGAPVAPLLLGAGIAALAIARRRG